MLNIIKIPFLIVLKIFDRFFMDPDPNFSAPDVAPIRTQKKKSDPDPD